MLAATAVASPPFALMPFTTSSHAGSLRLETTTLAPCAAICSQIERPMPRLPPVTTATLPVDRTSSKASLRCQRRIAVAELVVFLARPDRPATGHFDAG